MESSTLSSRREEGNAREMWHAVFVLQIVSFFANQSQQSDITRKTILTCKSV